MKRFLSGALVLVLSVFAFNMYKYKVQQKPENKVKIEKTLKDAGIDEDTVNAVGDTVDTLNTGVVAIDEAKKLIGDAVSSDMIKEVDKGSDNQDESAAGQKKENIVDKTTDTAKRLAEDEAFRKQVTDEVATEIQNRAEELPALSEEDVDEIIDRVAEKVSETCSEENINYYFQNKDLDEFNSKITETVTQDKFGIISKFMQYWIKKMPNINDVDPRDK